METWTPEGCCCECDLCGHKGPLESDALGACALAVREGFLRLQVKEPTTTEPPTVADICPACRRTLEAFFRTP